MGTNGPTTVAFPLRFWNFGFQNLKTAASYISFLQQQGKLLLFQEFSLLTLGLSSNPVLD